MMYCKGKYIVEGKNYNTFKEAMRDVLLKKMINLGVDVDQEATLNSLNDYVAVKMFFELNHKKVLEPEFIQIPCNLKFNNLSNNIIEFKCN